MEGSLSELDALKRENLALRERIAQLEQQLDIKHETKQEKTSQGIKEEEALKELKVLGALNAEEIQRYGRQMIMKEIGVEGQKKLKESKVIVIGAGGIGSSALLYLAAAGIGTLGTLDYDPVEVSNLHRQIIHSTKTIGVHKAVSAKQSIESLNPAVKCRVYEEAINSKNAMDILKDYDIVVDSTDNVPTRYLLNDACVLLNKILVSGAALRFEGQLTVYNYNKGPCYRCIFPTPPPPESVTDCSSGGVLGVVPGIIGCLQALEVVKLVTGNGEILSQKLLLFDALSTRFQNVKLRPRNTKCAICGDAPTITTLIDYEMFCSAKANDKTPSVRLLEAHQSISCQVECDYSSSLFTEELQEYSKILLSNTPHVLLDVRSDIQYSICKLSNALSFPLACIPNRIEEIKSVIVKDDKELPVYVLCRRGNDSQRAVIALQKHGIDNAKNIAGGLLAWANSVDPTFPIY